jgi:hypothetical protein
MKIAYIEKNLRPETLAVIKQANDIIIEYINQGFDLTLRQLYYQFVAKGFIPNTERDYKRLGSIVNDARLCGLMNWEAIVDRTRFKRSNSHWRNPASVLKSAGDSFEYDKWHDQKKRYQVWIEKDALIGILDDICPGFDVPYLSCRGYVSQSEMWRGSQTMVSHYQSFGQETVILYLGDHDPSGINMVSDISSRLATFCIRHGVVPPDIKCLALNMDQIKQYNPPPNPAKMSDSRAPAYVKEYGYDSWELDALDPTVLADLVKDELTDIIDWDKFDATVEREQKAKELLYETGRRWDEVQQFLEN